MACKLICLLVFGFCCLSTELLADEYDDILQVYRDLANRLLIQDTEEVIEYIRSCAQSSQESSIEEAIVGVAELIYLEMNYYDANYGLKRDWIIQLLNSIDWSIYSSGQPHGRSIDEALSRAKVMVSILADKQQISNTIDTHIDKDNGLYLIVKVRNAYRQYNWKAARLLIDQYNNSPSVILLHNELSLKRISLAMQCYGLLNDRTTRNMVMLKSPEIDDGLIIELSNIFALSMYMPYMLITLDNNLCCYPRSHRVGVFLAMCIRGQCPQWSITAPFMALQQILHGTTNYNIYKSVDDIGKPSTERQLQWYKKYATLRDQYIKECLEEIDTIEGLYHEGDIDKIREYIEDPIMFMKRAGSHADRETRSNEWIALWKEWEEIACNMRRQEIDDRENKRN